MLFRSEGEASVDLATEWVRAVLVQPPCPADLNGDSIVDQGDIQSFITLFLAGDAAADLNGDTVVDQGDIQSFIAFFLEGC